MVLLLVEHKKMNKDTSKGNKHLPEEKNDITPKNPNMKKNLQTQTNHTNKKPTEKLQPSF